MTDVLAEWDKDPGKMFEWRGRVLKMSLLVLEEIIKRPAGQGRSQDLARVRAISQLQSLTIAMESIRSSIPVVCPNCEKEFNLP